MRRLHRWLSACNRVLTGNDDVDIVRGYENAICSLRSGNSPVCEYGEFFRGLKKKETKMQHFQLTPRSAGINKSGGKIANIQTAEQFKMLADAGLANWKKKA